MKKQYMKQNVEIWKDIEGYNGIYQVSNIGRIKSLKFGKEKILKNNKDTKGYFKVNLCKNGKMNYYKVHRLVAMAFIPNPENKPYIDHINTDCTDNRVENLRWVTNKENCNNPISKINYSNAKSKPILQFDKNMNFIRQWSSISDVKRELGFDIGCISKCCNGKRKYAGGYIWRYYYKGIWLKNHIPLKEKKAS